MPENQVFRAGDDPDNLLGSPEFDISNVVDNERPLAGAVLPGEPDDIEIAEAAVNAPSPKHVVKFRGEDLELVELGFAHWHVYVSSLLPPTEKALKDILPLITSGTRSWLALKNTNGVLSEQLRTTARTGDNDLLLTTLMAMGITDATIGDSAQLIDFANEPEKFTMYIGQMLTRPVLNSLSQINISDILSDALLRLPAMATASISAALARTGASVNSQTIGAEVRALDGFDLFEIVMEQIALYQERGKVRSFFGRILELVTKKIGSVMPTV
jgi:hypothetical protein